MTARGFTLIEVLVALAILALVAAAVSRQSSQVLNDLRRLEDRTQAFWLADNEMTRMRIQEPWPALGQRSRPVDTAQRRWLVSVTVTGTANVDIRRIDISVAADDRDRQPLLTLTGYGGRH